MQTKYSLTDAIQLHQLDCRAQRFTDKTVESYRTRLTAFVRFAGDVPLAAVTPDLLRNFLADLSSRGLSDVYIVGLFRSLRAFLNYCVRDGLISETPMKTLRMPRMAKRVRYTPTDDEFERVLNACESLRDRALVLLLASSGIRNAEACALNLQDLDLTNGALRVVQGKGRKDRITYVDPAALKAVRKYLVTRGKVKPTHPLIASTTRLNGRLNTNGIAQALGRLQDKSGVPVTAHSLRRLFATRAARKGLPLPLLTRIMGHADLQTLRSYLDLDDAAAQDAYRAAFG